MDPIETDRSDRTCRVEGPQSMCVKLVESKPDNWRLELLTHTYSIYFYLHEQYLEDFLNLKVDRDNVFLGSGLVGGEYTEPVAMV